MLCACPLSMQTSAGEDVDSLQAQIAELRRSMSPSLFAANYELRHIASENALFTTPPVFTDNPEMLRDGIAHIDAAYGGADDTAFTCAKRVGDELILYGRLWHKHVDDVLDSCIAEANRLMCAPIYCEDNGDKGFLAREIARRGMASRPYREYQNKHLKISNHLRKWWGKVAFLEGTDEAYVAQIMSYREGGQNHDDAPDSAACVARYWGERV